MKKFVYFVCSVIAGAVMGVGVFRVTRKKQEKAREENRHVPYGAYEAVIKRPLDVVVSGIALILLWPVMAAIGMLVRIKLGSPVLFIQERPGKDGKIFKLYKFRSMTNAKDRKGNLLPDEERMTNFGRVLRNTSLDELPELFNILRGDMAIVGPRPLLVEYLPYYNEKERKRHDVRPGLTGLAQVHGRNNLKWDERFEVDVQYADKIIFVQDLKIIFETIQKVFMHLDISDNTKLTEGNFAEMRKKELYK